MTERQVTWDEVLFKHSELHSSDPADETTSHRRCQSSFFPNIWDYLKVSCLILKKKGNQRPKRLDSGKTLPQNSRSGFPLKHGASKRTIRFFGHTWPTCVSHCYKFESRVNTGNSKCEPQKQIKSVNVKLGFYINHLNKNDKKHVL